jgi:hypothetical protein
MRSNAQALVMLVSAVGVSWSDADAQRVGNWVLSERPVAEITELPRSVRRAARLTNGSVAVVGGNQLRLFGPEGALSRMIGGSSDSDPFTSAAGVVVLPGDTIVVWDDDRARPRLSFFSAAGALERVQVLPPFLTATPPRREVHGTWRTMPSPLTELQHGGLILARHYAFRPAALAEPPGMYTRVATLLLADTRTDRIDTLGVYPYLEQIRTHRGESVLPLRPFGRRLLAATAPSGAIFIGTGVRAEIVAVDRRGRHVATIRMPEQLQRVTSRERRAAIDTLKRYVRLPETSWLASSIPDYFPPYLTLMFDREGLLWVERYRRPGEVHPRWWVFDPRTGALVANARTPAGATVHDIGRDYMVLAFADSNGNPRSLQVRPLRRP